MDAQENRRKSIHMLGGLGPPVAVLLFGWSGSVAILLFLLTYITIGGLLNLRGIRLPVIAALIQNTQRETERFPATAVEFLLSVLVLGALLPEIWFFPAIGVLAFGDGAAGLIGKNFGHHKLAWNRRKSWEGLAAGCVAGSLGAVVLSFDLHWRGLLLIGPQWLVPTVFIVVAFFAIVNGTGWVVRARHGEEIANAPLRTTLLAALIGLLVASLPLVLVATGRIPDRHLLEYSSLPLFVMPVFLIYSVLAVVVTMLLETILRRHDNLVLPLGYVVVLVSLVTWDPVRIGPAMSV